MHMDRLVQRVRRFVIAEDGPTAVEYAVLLAVIVLVVLEAVEELGSRTSASYNYVAGQLPSSGDAAAAAAGH
jgi:pilus assembly protein Flp/PilA